MNVKIKGNDPKVIIPALLYEDIGDKEDAGK